MDLWWCAFLLVCAYRYVRFIVNTISSWTFRSIPLPIHPRFTPSDVTVVIPTICGTDNEFFKRTLRSCLATGPYQVIVVTIDRDKSIILDLVKAIDPTIVVLSIRHPSKRRQLCAALRQVTTPITILADDDVIWPNCFLPYVLAPFEDPSVGAVGTLQKIRKDPTLGIFGQIIEYLGACYIERRNFEITATSHIDGGMSCLSGRTAVYRTQIISSDHFIQGFCQEKWAGKLLNTDDDNFLTRFLVAHNWKIVIQSSKRAMVETTLEVNSRFFLQCLRWARSNWRSNITSTFYERYVWRQQPWCIYALHMATLTHSIITDPLLVYLLHRSTLSNSVEFRQLSFRLLCYWMLIAKLTKLLPHFARHPGDVVFFPVTLVFGYLHGLIKYYALLTIGETAWGSRPAADAETS